MGFQVCDVNRIVKSDRLLAPMSVMIVVIPSIEFNISIGPVKIKENAC